MRLIKIYNIRFNDGTEATYYLQSVNSAEDLFEKLNTYEKRNNNE